MADQHFFTAGGHSWSWRLGSSVVLSCADDTRLVMPGCARSPETVEAFVHGWIEGCRQGLQRGRAEGAGALRHQLRQLLGVPDAATMHQRLGALEPE